MFEHKKVEEAKIKVKALAHDQPVQDFLQIWQAMKEEVKDNIRLKKLELRVDSVWQSLSQEHKDVVWMICFPEHCRVKEVFEAHAVSLQ